MTRLARFAWVLVIAVLAYPVQPLAQTTSPATDVAALVREVCNEQIRMLQRHDTRLRYRVHRVTHKDDTIRDTIESLDGGVARLLQRNGQRLTADEDQGERRRLELLIGSSKVQQRERDEQKNREYGVELLQVFPTAMHFTQSAHAVPVQDAPAHQIILDFTPDPSFRPSGIAQQILTCLSGRLWIDADDRRLLRMELRNNNDVNLAWGILAKVYGGGTILYEQRKFEDLYSFTHIVMHLRIRELMLKTQNMDVETTASGFQRLPKTPGSDEAVRILLAEPVPTR